MVLSPLRRLLPPILLDTFTGAGKKRKLDETETVDESLHVKGSDASGLITPHEDRYILIPNFNLLI